MNNIVENWLRNNIKDINFQLYHYAQENAEYAGTTCVCALVLKISCDSKCR